MRFQIFSLFPNGCDKDEVNEMNLLIKQLNKDRVNIMNLLKSNYEI